METTDTEKFMTVAMFTDVTSADILVAKLNSCGIPAGVFNFSSAYPCLGNQKPIEVKVNESDYEAALALVPEDDRPQE